MKSRVTVGHVASVSFREVRRCGAGARGLKPPETAWSGESPQARVLGGGTAFERGGMGAGSTVHDVGAVRAIARQLLQASLSALQQLCNSDIHANAFVRLARRHEPE